MLKCASFFAGVGGIDLGFKQAGFDIVFANEFDPNACKTFQANFKTKLDSRSIIDLPTQDIPDFDVMIAGFPCQAFSIAGKRQGFNDKGRGDLFFELERIFKAKKPKIIFLENVKNLVSHDKGRTFEIIKQSLISNGYHIKFQVLNASQFGVAQNRERIYIVCFLDKALCDKFEFPKPFQLNKQVSDYLENESNIDSKYYYEENTPFFNELSIVSDAKTVYQWRRKYVRKNMSNLCPTLTANMGTGGHNVPLINPQGKRTTVRKLTPRECFNFQGYPKDFILPKLADCHLYKQAGNSVVVPVIRQIAEQIILTLK
jgi:modification methylase bsp6I